MVELPTISVVIPCYNGARFLRETLTSVARQTYAPQEVIVIDDGSTDDSAAIAATFAPLVRVVRQENQGESVARNRGVALSTGDWVALLDADDRWEPRKLERQASLALSQPAAISCIYTDYYKFDQMRKVSCEQPVEYHALTDARVRLLFDWCVVPSSALIRRDVVRTVRFPENIRHGEDIIFFALLHDHGCFVRVPEELTGYRVSSLQQTRASGHSVGLIRSKFHWFSDNEANYSVAEVDYVRARMRNELVGAHDTALWQRRHTLVREYRLLFTELYGDEAVPPASFHKRLHPEMLCRLKDLIDGFLLHDA